MELLSSSLGSRRWLRLAGRFATKVSRRIGRESVLTLDLRQVNLRSSSAGLSIYYSQSDFYLRIRAGETLNSFDILADCFEAIGEPACKQLTRVEIRMDMDCKVKVMHFLPFVRIFARRSYAIPKVSCLFLDYVFWAVKHAVEADPWVTELVRDMAEIGLILGERWMYDPHDETIKAALWYCRPVLSREEDRKLQTFRLWENMEPVMKPGMEQWLFPLPW